MSTILCSCCKAEVTAPVFVGNKPYGWSCAKKFTGNSSIKKGVKMKVVRIVKATSDNTKPSSRFIFTLEDGRKIAGYTDIRALESGVIVTSFGIDLENFVYYEKA
jgi:hypothetical protein